jgi:hypothetical protein
VAGVLLALKLLASSLGEPEAEAPIEEVMAVRPIWDALAVCESSSRWHIYNPPYAGGLQMDATFWRRYGGTQFAPRPDLASREQQVVIAERGLAVQGWGAWPACSRRLGLR